MMVDVATRLSLEKGQGSTREGRESETYVPKQGDGETESDVGSVPSSWCAGVLVGEGKMGRVVRGV